MKKSELSELSFHDVRRNWKAEHALWDNGSTDAPTKGAALRIHRDTPVELRHIPKFKLDPKKSGFTIGSCFARGIEQALRQNEIDLPDHSELLPNSLMQFPSIRYNNSYLNRFNPNSMQREIENLTGDPLPDEQLIYRLKDGLAIDSHYSPSIRPQPHEEFARLREGIRETSRPYLEKGGFLILTLGLTETMFDKKLGLALNMPPPPRLSLAEPDRFVGRAITVAETQSALEAIRTCYRNVNKADGKIIITVSPVALQRSFDGRDIVVANAGAKATLRAAAEEFCRSYDDVDYFPSYEIVTHTAVDTAFRPDYRHVQLPMVDEITSQFISTYFDADS